MPLQTATTTLQAAVDPVQVIHDESECRVDVQPDQVRIRSVSDDKSIALDYVLPLPAQSVAAAPADFWVAVDSIDEFLEASSDVPVTVTFPFERADSRLALEADGLNYRFAPFRDRAEHRLFDAVRSRQRTMVRLTNGKFARSVRVAALIDDELSLSFTPDTERLQFSASASGGDSFTYTPRVEHVEAVDHAALQLTIPIKHLQNLLSYIPEASPAVVNLRPDSMTYCVEHPCSGAAFTLHIAQRRQAIH